MNKDILLAINLRLGITEKLHPQYSEDYYQVTKNILKLCNLVPFERAFFVSDYGEGFYYYHDYDLIKRIKIKQKEFHKKTTASAAYDNHIKGLIKQYKNITIVGHNLSVDIIPTIHDLSIMRKNIIIVPSCIGDIDLDIKIESIKQIKSISSQVNIIDI